VTRPGEEDDGPVPLLVEEIIERPRRAIRRRRVTADARFFEYTDVETRSVEGRVMVERCEPGWRFRRKLGHAQMRALFAALEESGFFALDGEYRSGGSGGSGGGDGETVVTWRAALLGWTHEVRLVGLPRASVATIRAVEQVFNQTVGGGSRRAAGGGGVDGI
jgi:hypothetical protein